jgi:hypothetical protein
MHERISRAGVVAVGLALTALTASLPSAAQNQSSSPWEHPTTPWGDPDLQGMWPINHMTLVPLVRPEQFGDRNVLTDEEFAQREQMLSRRNQAYEAEQEQDKMGMGHWAEAGQVPTRVASLIVDPPDGQFPEMTEEGKRRSATMGTSWFRDTWDTPEDFDVWDRCITRGLPASMFPMQYNNGIEILQAPGHVVLRLEMIHEARIIPVDGSPPLDGSIKQWMGESRGRWEGNTLVVETTNFNGIAHMTNIGTSGSPRYNTPTSEALHITERFTRVSDTELEYEITVEDPVVIERPWTAAYTWVLNPDYEIFEYACHEGNEQIRNYIETSRHERRQQARNEN